MAILTVFTATNERSNSFWNEHGVGVVDKLGEVWRTCGDILDFIESSSSDMNQVRIEIKDGEGWCSGDEESTRDVDIVISAPYDDLVKLLANNEFRHEYFDVDLDEALELIAKTE